MPAPQAWSADTTSSVSTSDLKTQAKSEISKGYSFRKAADSKGRIVIDSRYLETPPEIEWR